MEGENNSQDSGQQTPEAINPMYLEAIQQLERRLQATESGLQSSQNAFNASMNQCGELEEIVRTLSASLRVAQQATTNKSAGTVIYAAGSKDWKPPQWDGNADNFVDYAERLRHSYKTRSALSPPLSANIYWNAIFDSIKDSKKRSRMRHYWLAGADSVTKDPEEFISEIEHIFGESNEKGKALEQLVVLRHELGQPWRDHQRNFDGLLLTARGDLFPDDVKITHLRNTFSNPVKLNLVSMKETSAYYEFVKEVDRIMSNYEETDQFKKLHWGWKSRNTESAFLDSGSGQPSGNISTSRTTDREGDVIMNVSRSGDTGRRQDRGGGQKRRAVWVDKSELDKRRKNGQCFRCGDSGHRLKDCPHLSPTRPVSINAIRSNALLEEETEFPESGANLSEKE